MQAFPSPTTRDPHPFPLFEQGEALRVLPDAFEQEKALTTYAAHLVHSLLQRL